MKLFIYKTCNTQWNIASMWNDEFLTNRRDVGSKFNCLIPFEISALCHHAEKSARLTCAEALLHGVTLVSLQREAGRICFTRHFGSRNFPVPKYSCSELVERCRPQWKHNQHLHKHSPWVLGMLRAGWSALRIWLRAGINGMLLGWVGGLTSYLCTNWARRNHMGKLSIDCLWRTVPDFLLSSRGKVSPSWRSKRWQSCFLQHGGKHRALSFASMNQGFDLDRLGTSTTGRGRSLTTAALKV